MPLGPFRYVDPPGSRQPDSLPEPFPWNTGNDTDDEFRQWCRRTPFGNSCEKRLFEGKFRKYDRGDTGNPIPRFARRIPQNWTNVTPWQIRILKILWEIFTHCRAEEDVWGERSLGTPVEVCNVGLTEEYMGINNTCQGIVALGGIWAYAGRPPNNQPGVGAAFQTLKWVSAQANNIHFYKPVKKYAGQPGWKPVIHQRTKVKPNPLPKPSPKPVPDPIAWIPPWRPRPPWPPEIIHIPPGPGKKERKIKFHHWIMDWVGGFTEFDEWLDCALEAMGKSTKGMNTYEKFRYAYKHWTDDNFDIQGFLMCAFLNQHEDRIIGELMQLTKDQLQLLFDLYGMNFFRMHITDQRRIIRELRKK